MTSRQTWRRRSGKAIAPRFRHVFRHAYGGFDFTKAQSNVQVAARVIPRLRDEITAFAAGLGLAPRA